MYRILMSYLERLSSAMEMREGPSGEPHPECVFAAFAAGD